MKIRYIFSFIFWVFVFSCAQNKSESATVENISSEEVCRKVSSNQELLLLDVRTEEEYTGSLGHLKNSTLIPLGELESRLSEIENYKNKEIIVYCRSGTRSAQASSLLISRGFTDVNNMLGGMMGWNSASTFELPCKDELLEK